MTVFWNWESHFTHYTRNSIVTRLRTGRSGVLILTRTTNFSLLLEIQSFYGVHAAIYSMNTKVLSRKQSSKSDVDVPLPSRSEVQNSGAITLVPINALIECKGTTLPFITHQYCEHNINVSFIKARYVWDLDSISYFRDARASWSFFPLNFIQIIFAEFRLDR
jgi:hypothetical protein